MNKVLLIGNVGKEPEVRYYEQDQAVASFPLATTERGYTLQNGTQVPDRTDWHNIVLYRGLAKVAEKYIHKGDKLYIEGRIRYRSYDDQKGMRRYVTEILAENMEMLTLNRLLYHRLPESRRNPRCSRIKQHKICHSDVR